jgi:hypothetical protein
VDQRILAAITEEIAKLQQARALLVGNHEKSVNPVVGKQKRTLSAKARKAIAVAQRKRWAKAKSAKAAS